MESNRVPGQEIMPQHVNRFHVVANPNHVRIIFGDAAIGTDATMHTAVVMTTADAQELANLLSKLIEESRLLKDEGKPNVTYN